LTWVGGAWAYHQHHASPDPPVQHLHDIIRNAAIFHRRWGWWPMTGWLREFERRGFTVFDRTQTWQAAPPRRAPRRHRLPVPVPGPVENGLEDRRY
jgi:N-acetylglucosaminyl-diphospho-decaprenol L-rhamnosyltransferase